MVMAIDKSTVYEVFGNQFSRLQWLYHLISHYYHRFTGLDIKHLKTLKVASVRPDATLSFHSGGLKLVGDLYQPKGASNGATILLLHGSSIFGRKLSLMKALAGEFQQLGYAVFTFDLRAYGDSEDPQTYTPEAFDFAGDVSAAIDLLSDRYPELAQNIYVIGHSFGGAVAIASQARDARIKKIVSFGPPRRLSERFLNPEAREKKKLLVRWQADMQLAQPLNFQVWEQVLKPLNIENYVENFASTGHTPMFLIDAENEPAADIEFLRSFSSHMKPPSSYWTVPATDHYLGSGFLFGMPCYNTTTVCCFVDRVSHWLQDADATP